ncbi:MAG: hypothetical protein Q4A97_04870, partial [Comamonadaceae bacterium]|nr:hypothetical protein [Comamonadaceae bacterium]
MSTEPFPTAPATQQPPGQLAAEPAAELLTQAVPAPPADAAQLSLGALLGVGSALAGSALRSSSGLAAMVAFTLAACGGGGGDAAPPAPGMPPAPGPNPGPTPAPGGAPQSPPVAGPPPDPGRPPAPIPTPAPAPVPTPPPAATPS